jgi:hypothetical protein
MRKNREHMELLELRINRLKEKADKESDEYEQALLDAEVARLEFELEIAESLR